MIDFTSALYLGMRHASEALPAWERLTDGKPSALEERRMDESTAAALAQFQGCQAGTLGTSTLHLFWDLGGLLSGSPFLVDSAAYAIGRWGAERARAGGSLIKEFSHYRPESLRQALDSIPHSRRPVVLLDGFCPGCGRAAPIPEVLELARAYGGLVIVDDTQSLGIFGVAPDASNPYGTGGGGSLCRWAVDDEHLILVASLAKGFGAPVAILSGSKARVLRFREHSATRQRCSPPSAANVGAAAAALTINQLRGDRIRRQLYQRVHWFRAAIAAHGIRLRGGDFPVQTLVDVPNPEALHRALMTRDIATVLHRPTSNAPAQISFIITATHSLSDLRAAVRGTSEAIRYGAKRGAA